MLETELLSLIEKIKKQKTESNYLEIKSAKGGCPKIIDTLSAFSNSDGGTIVFGIEESDGYNVCGVYDAADLQKKIMEQSEQMQPVVRPLCTVAVIDDKCVVSAEIAETPESDKPCFYRGGGLLKGSYIRVGDADKQMTPYEVYSFEAFRKNIHDELRITDRSDISDIDTTELMKYKITLTEKKPNFSAMPDERLYKLQGFADNGTPTLAGIMLFCDYPQGYYPQLCITAVVIPGKQMSETGDVGERFTDNKRIEGTIPQMFEETLAFVKRNMRIKTIIDDITGMQKTRTDYPIIAIRELLLNALIHRDYSTYTENAPITVRMFSDRIEIENPGGLYGKMTVDNLGKIAADTRNPRIAGALETMGLTENRYSGIPAVRNACENNGIPEPKFENDRGSFRVTLYSSTVYNSEAMQNATKNLESFRSLITLPPYSILEFCKTPRSRAELAEHYAGRFSINYLMTNYVHPLVEEGVLKLTLPDKPRSKNQMYVTAQQ
jgi:ATP-dependent DNA helicase RecG